MAPIGDVDVGSIPAISTNTALSPNGKAEDCKPSIGGSIPSSASIPKVLRIGGFDIEVIMVDETTQHGNPPYGWFDYQTQRIFIAKDYQTPKSIIDTLFHEIGRSLVLEMGNEREGDRLSSGAGHCRRRSDPR